MKVTLKANETLEQLQAIIDEGGTHTPREAKRFAELGGGAQAGQSQDARQQKPMSYISNRGTLVKVNRDDKKDYAVPPQEAARLAAPPRGGNQENQEAGTKDVFDMVIQEGDAPGAGPAEWQRAADAEDRTYTRRSMTTKQAHQILERNGINPDAIKSIVMDVLKGSDGDGLTAKQKLENMSSEELNKLYDRRAELTEDEERILSLADQQARQSSLGRRPEQPGGGERWDDY